MEIPLFSRLHRTRRRAYIESYRFPQALRDKLRQEFPDERHVSIAIEGLREWYLACLAAAGQMLAMPSRAVDIAWHEMILMTREYHRFCDRAFGHYLHHSPDAVMDVPMHDSLARTLAVLERQSPSIPGVPLLFAVDEELGIEDGFFWRGDDIERVREGQAVAHPTGRCASGSCGAGCAATGGSGGCGGGGCGGGSCGGGGCGGGGG